MIGGVCASLADYFGVDVLLVRIVAVILAVSGGAGLPAYLALWLLTPSEDGPAALASDSGLLARMRRQRILQTVGIVVLAVVLAGVVGHVLVLLVPLVAVGAIVAALVLCRRWWRALLAILLVVLVGLGVTAATGRHLGSRDFAAGRAVDIADGYGSPVGTVRLDLRGLALDHDRSTTVWVGSGDVVIEVAPDLPVHVDARTGAGSVSVFGRTASGPGAEVVADSGPRTPMVPRLAIKAQAGTGHVRVETAD
jgi:phage shock protein PspC (stress-responsive transcriptional regulator)